MRVDREVLIKDTVIYTASNYISLFMGFFVGIFSKRFLGVTGAGYWALLTVVETYGMYVSFGMQNTLLRELPQAIGAGEQEKGKRLIDVTFSFLLIACIAGVLGIWILAPLFCAEDATMMTGTRLTALLVLVTHMYNLMITIMRATKRLVVLGGLIIYNTVLVAVFSLSGAYFFGVLGYVAGMILSTMLSFFIAVRWTATKLSWQIDWPMIGSLIRVGLVMTFANFLLKTVLNMDRMMIGGLLGMEALGLYSIALMAENTVSSIPKFINIAVFPHIQERYGATRKAADLKGMVLRPTALMARVLPFMIGGLVFFIEPIVYYFLPKFTNGLTAMKILMMGSYFLALSHIPSSFIFTINRQILFVPFYAGLVIINAGLNYVFIRAGFSIEGVAVATSVVYLLSFIIPFVFAARHFISRRETAVLAAEVAALYIYFLINFLWIDLAIRSNDVVMRAAYKMLCLTAVSIPVLIDVERKEHLLTILLSFVRTGKNAYYFTREDVIRGNRALYSATARVYDEEHRENIFSHEHQKRIGENLMFMAADLRKNGKEIRLVDAGCGTGNVLALSKCISDFVVGCDLSPECLKEASGRCERLIETDVSHLPFVSGSVDIIVAHSVLHHLFDYSEFLRDAYRVMSTGGWLYTDFDHNAVTLRHIFARLKNACPAKDAIKKMLGRKDAPYEITDFKLANFHNEFKGGISPFYLKRLLGEIGFSNILIRVFNRDYIKSYGLFDPRMLGCPMFYCLAKKQA